MSQAAAEVGMAERELLRLELGLQQRLAAVYERYASARFQVAQYRDTILPDAREALRLTSENYRAGKVEYDDLLTSQRTNAQANLDYLNSLRELRIAEAEMEGFLLTGSLDQRVASTCWSKKKARPQVCPPCDTGDLRSNKWRGSGTSDPRQVLATIRPGTTQCRLAPDVGITSLTPTAGRRRPAGRHP